ncbi:MAG: DUF1932 domain-containing protein [Gemmatimonadetes bacterium]|nr:DUF1932 domain-containing protein [Gemmatimonadota bacterium]
MVETVGISSPGEMGHAVAKVLVDRGLPVIACLEGRSERSRERAASAGIEAVPTLADVARRAGIFLSILPPAHAREMARQVAATGETITYVDCNAVSPATAAAIGATAEAAGLTFIDAGIVGPPPLKEGTTRFYASGERVEEFEELSRYGLDVRVVGGEIGQASGLKMCYASQTKGRYAIFIESLVAAQRLGCYDLLVEELKMSQAATLADTEKSVPNIPSKAGRWIAEMEEIAATFAEAGMTDRLFHGVADMYRAIDGADPDALSGVELEQLIARLARDMD